MNGYSPSDLDEAQQRWGLRFPPDLMELLRDHRPLLSEPGSFDWLRSDPAIIRDKLDWPFESFWFDVEHDQAWWPEWGEMPADLARRGDKLRQIFSGVPRLIPLFGHRYLPEEPSESGNPVFSVWQTDVIYYGANLKDWLDRETDAGAWERKPWPPIKPIRFWSEAVDRNKPQPGGRMFLNRVEP